MTQNEAIAAAVGTIQQRWGPHSLTKGWTERSRQPVRTGDKRPSWWPGVLGHAARPSVMELTGPPSCGKLSLALLWLAALPDAGLIAVVDETGQFYPPAAAACGLDLERLVIVRPPNARAALDAAMLLLGSEGFDAVLWTVDSKTRLTGAAGAKLAHLANRSGTTLVALVSSFTPRASRHAFHSTLDAQNSTRVPGADIRLRVVDWEWLLTDGELGGARLQVRAERLRAGAPGQDWELTLTHQRSVRDGGTKDHMRLDTAFPLSGGDARTTGSQWSSDSDLQAGRALAGAS